MQNFVQVEKDPFADTARVSITFGHPDFRNRHKEMAEYAKKHLSRFGPACIIWLKVETTSQGSSVVGTKYTYQVPVIELENLP
tara:strand:+ start:1765 stop:2013 length:249 start_codon:yes stop_codon:yes gene_type:complete